LASFGSILSEVLSLERCLADLLPFGTARAMCRAGSSSSRTAAGDGLWRCARKLPIVVLAPCSPVSSTGLLVVE